MTSTIRFQVNSVRSIGTQGSKLESLVGVHPNLGITGKVIPVEAPGAVKPALTGTQRDPGKTADEFTRATRPPGARDKESDDETGHRRSSAPIPIPFVALQRAVAAFGATRPREEGRELPTSEPEQTQKEEVQASAPHEDPFLLVREHLKQQADEGAAKDAKLEPSLFDLPKEPAKPFGRARPFEFAEASETQGNQGSNRRSKQAPVAEAALRGAITEGLAGVGLPPRVARQTNDSTGSSSPASRELNAGPVRRSAPPQDSSIRLPRGLPRAEIASSQYRAVEDHDYAKLLAVPGDGSGGGRWSRIGATLPTFAFSVTS